jgi:hypothetical protein
MAICLSYSIFAVNLIIKNKKNEKKSTTIMLLNGFSHSLFAIKNGYYARGKY